MTSTGSIFDRALICLSADDPDEKIQLTRQASHAWKTGPALPVEAIPPEAISQAGHPVRPELVHPRYLSRRSLATEQGRGALIHAVAHIEFNAINLAWDAVYRFRGLPSAFYSDWIQVALEEARHFESLRGRLRELDFDYGDFPAHNGLWDMARRTAHDVLVRMAMVPRVLEARGLDVTPDMIRRFQSIGDHRTAALLQTILADEVGHVRAGTRWFHYLCRQRGVEPERQYFALLDEYLRGEVRCPLHLEARREAGFSDSELERLERLCKRT